MVIPPRADIVKFVLPAVCVVLPCIITASACGQHDQEPKSRGKLEEVIPGFKARYSWQVISTLEKSGKIVICLEELASNFAALFNNSEIQLDLPNCLLREALDALCEATEARWEYDDLVVNIKASCVPQLRVNPLNFKVKDFDFGGHIFDLFTRLEKELPDLGLVPVLGTGSTGDIIPREEFQIHISQPCTVRQILNEVSRALNVAWSARIKVETSNSGSQESKDVVRWGLSFRKAYSSTLQKNKQKPEPNRQHGESNQQKTAPKGNGENEVGDSNSKSVHVEKTEPEAEPVQVESQPGREWLVICLIVAGLVITGLVVFLLLRRKK